MKCTITLWRLLPPTIYYYSWSQKLSSLFCWSLSVFTGVGAVCVLMPQVKLTADFIEPWVFTDLQWSQFRTAAIHLNDVNCSQHFSVFGFTCHIHPALRLHSEKVYNITTWCLNLNHGTDFRNSLNLCLKTERAGFLRNALQVVKSGWDGYLRAAGSWCQVLMISLHKCLIDWKCMT